jgi:hypothetical protein
MEIEAGQRACRLKCVVPETARYILQSGESISRRSFIHNGLVFQGTRPESIRSATYNPSSDTCVAVTRPIFFHLLKQSWAFNPEATAHTRKPACHKTILVGISLLAFLSLF